jgi:hypothetical protein
LDNNKNHRAEQSRKRRNLTNQLELSEMQQKQSRQGRAEKKTHTQRKANGTHKGEYKHMHSRAQQHRAENL